MSAFFLLIHFHVSSMLLQYDRRNKPEVVLSQYKMIKWKRTLKGDGVLNFKVHSF